MTEADEVLVALVKLSPERRLTVLELLPEWQRLTRTNDLRATVRREVLDAMIDVFVGAQKHYTADGDPLNSLAKVARGESAKLRISERDAKEKPR
jgi:hypothetical protein